MGKIVLGKVGLTLDGDYDISKSYTARSCVLYEGESWASKKDVPAGIKPSTGSGYWQKIAAKGSNGNSSFDGTGIEIVNNLTQGGADAALSAEQGKILKQGLDELEERVDNLGEGGSGSGSTGGTDLSKGGKIDGDLDVTGDLDVGDRLTVGNHQIRDIEGSLQLNAGFGLNIHTDGAPSVNINGMDIIHKGNLASALEDLDYTGSGSTGGTDLSKGGTINGSLGVTGTLTVDRNLYLKGDNAYHLIKADADGNLVISSDKVLEVSTNGGMTIDGYEAIHAGNIGNHVIGGTGGTVDTSNLVNLTGSQTITGPKTFEAIRIHGNAQLLTDLSVPGAHSIGSDESPLGSLSTKRAAVIEVLVMGDGSYVLGNLIPNADVKNTLGSAETPWETLYAKNVVIGRDGLEGTAATIWSKINLYNDVTVRGHLKVVDQDVITQKVITRDSNTVTLAEEGGIYIINTPDAGDVTISAFEAPYTDIGRYTFIFRGASSLTLPSNVLWANGTVPTIEADKYYELSVMATKIAGTTYYKAILAGFKAA